MKVHFKRLAAAAAAVAMSLSLSASALAEGTDVANGSLTVTGDQLAGKYVYAIQMFEAHALDHGAGEDPRYTYDSYTLNEKWLSFFNDENNISKEEWVAAGVIAKPADKIEDYSDAAVEYLQYLAEENNEMKVPAFAEKAQDWAENQKVFTRNLDEETGKVESVSVAAGWKAEYALADEVGGDETKGSATFNLLAAGYYLVYPEGGSTGKAGETQGVYTEAARGTDAMLINIPTNEANTTWNIKSTYPTVDKMVNDGNENTPDKGGADEGNADNGSAQVGDTVTFTLKSTVPDMSDYTTFYFAFNDTMSKGLEFVEKTSDSTIDAKDVTVKIGEAEVDTGYTVTLTDKKLKVEFTNLRTVPGAITGATITVTYQAKITEEAVSTGDNIFGTAENEANVEYSNDPSGDGHGTSTPDITKVYTYDIDVNKWAQNDTGTGKIEDLAGAEFILSTNPTAPSDTQISGGYIGYDGLVKLFKLSGDNSYRVAKPNEGNAVNSFTTTATGDINIAGLKAGTYYLHEVNAPDGYNKLKKPVKIEIVVEGGNYEHATIKVNGGNASGADGNVIDVENKKGIELPETGSIGTIGLTALGVVVVVAGLFAFPRKKKTRQD